MNNPIKYSDIYLEFHANIIRLKNLAVVEEVNAHGQAYLSIETEDISGLKAEINLSAIFHFDKLG